MERTSTSPIKETESESAVASAASPRTRSCSAKQRKRAKRRALRKLLSKVNEQCFQENLPGSKRLRRFFRARFDYRGTAEEARVAYARLSEPTYRAGESAKRMVSPQP